MVVQAQPRARQHEGGLDGGVQADCGLEPGGAHEGGLVLIVVEVAADQELGPQRQPLVPVLSKTKVSKSVSTAH